MACFQPPANFCQTFLIYFIGQSLHMYASFQLSFSFAIDSANYFHMNTNCCYSLLQLIVCWIVFKFLLNGDKLDWVVTSIKNFGLLINKVTVSLVKFPDIFLVAWSYYCMRLCMVGLLLKIPTLYPRHLRTELSEWKSIGFSIFFVLFLKSYSFYPKS